MRKQILLFSLLVLLPFALLAQYTPKVSPIKTPWTDKVDRSNPLPEYPRPQLVRADWMNLNGNWEFKSGASGDAVPVNQNLGGSILVPFPPQSTLSGVVKHFERMWYRRTFIVPTQWTGKRVLLHFGAIDWESEIFINGTSMGIHKGGYDEFSYDITDQLVGNGPQELIVRVYDPTRDFGQPRGKQTTSPGGIMYTPTTGIWQTVWLEPVTAENISGLKITPDIDNNQLKITVNSANATGLTVTATAKDGSVRVGSVSGNANTELVIPVPNAKLWSPDSPFLYDLDVQLKSGNQVIDSVSSYFGMRKIAMVRETPTPKLYLNNKPVYMMGPLDQGFWPDGIYTAPTDEALRFDIEATKALGFNMTRKHIKVEPQRWYYWADKLGIMVWQDMPSPNSYDAPAGMPIEKPQFDLELTRMINTHYNSPSIIMWVIFNEWQAEFESPRHALMVKALDPTRLVNQGSGHERADEGCDVLDGHYYSPPHCPSSTTVAVTCGEYGGIGLSVPGHLWSSAGNPYSSVATPEALIQVYSDYADKLIEFKKSHGMSAAVYTEITDVEIEVNGFLTYDRIYKVDPAAIRAINEKVINQNIVSNGVPLPTAEKAVKMWKYSTTLPAAGWNRTTFDDSAWPSAKGGFGTRYNDQKELIGTLWNNSDIWIRTTFNLGNLNELELKNLRMQVFHDENCEIYLNGVLAATLTGFVTDYKNVNISQAAKDALVMNGTNLIAIHCKQTIGGQYIDAGISFMVLTDENLNSHGPVVAYKDCNNSGTSTRLVVGEYNLEKLKSKGIADNDISSLKIAEGFKVILFDGDNFTGSSVELTASNACLDGLAWNDKATSLKVVPNGVTNLGGLYNIQNRNSNLNLEVAGGTTAIGNGVNVTQATPNENSNQQFLFTHIGNGVYKITAVHSLKQLDVNDRQAADSANVHQWLYTGEDNQLFIVVDAGEGFYKLVAKYSGRVVDVTLAKTTPGANVLAGINTNQTSAMWKLNPVSLSENGDGLLCNFYAGMNFENHVLRTKHAKIDFDWGISSPDPAVKVDKFSARWTGQIMPRYSELYTFSLLSDNGRRLWVDDQLVIDKWVSDWDIEYSGKIQLEAGRKYDIRVEYFEEVGGANIRLRWTSASQTREIIPQSCLYSNSLPSIKVTTPDNQASFGNTESVTLTATAVNPLGAITRVEFYNGLALLGHDTEAPYEFAWANMSPGSHTIRAVVVCDNAITLPSAPLVVEITNFSSVENPSEDLGFSVYPNPVDEAVFIRSGKTLQNVRYEIYNTAGQQFMSGIISGNSIPVAGLPKGIYSLRLTDKEVSVSKLVVKK